MTTYVIKIEQQTIPVPAEIGESDERVKQALAPFFPEASNAMITRVEKDDVVTINVVKKAGTKGADPLQTLERRKGGMNPAVRMYQEIQEMAGEEQVDPEKLLALNERIEKAIEDGRKDFKAIDEAAKRLEQARPQAAPEAPLGF